MPPRRGGRPSQEQAEKLHDHILDAATELFFTDGYGITSIEAIVGKAHISKRTFYHRFKDKADVFRAVVHRIVTRLRPPDVQGLFEGKSCEEILHRLAPLILKASLSPQALSLHRLILSESGRFPELALMVSAEGSRQEAVQRIGTLLQHEVKAGTLKIDDTNFAAEQLLQMIVSLPQRRALGLGKPMTDKELDQWVMKTVDLFLNGCRQKTA